MKLFCVCVWVEKTGPKGGRRKPRMDQYVVLAETTDEARTVFVESMRRIADITYTIAAVMPWGDRIARVA